MADPVTLTAISLGATAGSSIFGAIGSSMTGQAQSGMYQYQAAVAAANNQIALQNADYATKVGEVQAQQSGMQTRAQIGTTKAQQGAGGLDVNTGSASAVRTSEAEIGAENAALIRSNAAKTAYGYKVQAMNFTSQGQLDTGAAANASTAGTIGAVSSILGGAASVSSKWLGASSSGVFGGSGTKSTSPLSDPTYSNYGFGNA